MRRFGVEPQRVRSVDDDGLTTCVLFPEDVIEVLVGEVEDATARHLPA